MFEGRNSLYAPIPSVILPVEDNGDFIAQMQIKITNGYRREAIERYKRCHLRGNFPCLGEELAAKKGTEPLADATARLLGMRGVAPRPHGTSEGPSSHAFF